jgi:flagellar protein FliO/FliZ
MATIAMVGRLLLALCFVLGLMWVVGRWVRSRGNGRKGAATLAVLARQQLSRNSSVAVVKVLDQALILGITDGQVSMLGQSDLAEFEGRLAGGPALTKPRRRPALSSTAMVIDQSGEVAAPRPTALAGSALSLTTWRQAVDVIRERSVRRG